MINLAFPDFSFLDILKSCQDNDKRLYQNEVIIPRVNKKILEFGRLYDRCAQTNPLLFKTAVLQSKGLGVHQYDYF